MNRAIAAGHELLRCVAPRAPSAPIYVQSHIVFRFMNTHPTRILVLLDESCKNTDNIIISTLQENERPLNYIVHFFSIQYVSRQVLSPITLLSSAQETDSLVLFGPKSGFCDRLVRVRRRSPCSPCHFIHTWVLFACSVDLVLVTSESRSVLLFIHSVSFDIFKVSV